MRIFLIVLVILAAIILGYLLRRVVVQRLKKTVLDTWIVQTLGVIAILPPLIVGAIIAPIIWDSNFSFNIFQQLTSQIHVQDITSLTWSIVETVLIIVLGVGVARTVMKLTVSGLGENRVDINIRTLIGRIVYILVIITAAFWILSIWQISIGLPIAILGTLTVAFTFSIQDILKDLVAGFYILMERPFHIGDQIAVCNQVTTVRYTGKVEDVQLRATRLRLVSGEQVIIPNSLVFGGIVVNNTFYGERRATITVSLPNEKFNCDKTPDQILATLKEIDIVIAKPEPTIAMSGYVGQRLKLAVRFWVAHSDISAISDIMYKLRAALPDADLELSEAAGDI